MSILTPEEIGVLIGLSPTEQMEALIPAAEAWVQRECNCYVQERKAEVFDGPGRNDPTSDWGSSTSGGGIGSTILELRRWPIAEDDEDNTIILKIATDPARNFADADAIPRGSYYVDVGTEFPVLVYDAGFPSALRCVQFTCTAGYPEDEYPEPERELIAELVGIAADKLSTGSAESESAGGYSYSLPSFSDLESYLSPLGRATLENGRLRANVYVR